MLVGRCSSELSSHKLQAKSKESQFQAKPTCPGAPWRDLWFTVPASDMNQSTTLSFVIPTP